jgi:D-alanine-D-alanine ligase
LSFSQQWIETTVGNTDTMDDGEQMMNGWRVGLIFNMKKSVQAGPDAPPDALAEYDSEETVHALEAALTAGGHQVVLLEADESLPDNIRRVAPDICFNIAEGLRGDSRESHVPALLEMLGIPYTGAKVLGHAISLDKAITKRMWRDAGLPTAPFQTFLHGDEPIDPRMRFPLFVKPLREGTGMGINAHSVVRNEALLRQQVRWVIDSYHQPALVEGYLPGREFTVGLIGNTLLPGERRWNGLYNERGFHLFPILEIDANKGIGQGLYNVDAKSYLPGEEEAPLYFCPADIPASLERELRGLTIAAFEAIGALDLSRVDFRLGSDGRPYLMEINTLPGLKPGFSDLCIMAETEGIEYSRLINEILILAANRYAQEGKILQGIHAIGQELYVFQEQSLEALAAVRVGSK